jgi:hypothetical protein
VTVYADFLQESDPTVVLPVKSLESLVVHKCVETFLMQIRPEQPDIDLLLQYKEHVPLRRIDWGQPVVEESKDLDFNKSQPSYLW